MSKNKHLELAVGKEFVMRDIDAMIVPGILRYRGVPVTEFSKEQLVTILYQMTFTKDD